MVSASMVVTSTTSATGGYIEALSPAQLPRYFGRQISRSTLRRYASE
jgi:hypothetical protein